MKTRTVLAAVVLTVLAACTADSGPPLLVSNVEITTAMPGSKMSAGYMTISNRSGDVIEITRVSSPQFGNVEMHESVIEDGVSRMLRLDSLSIAPGESVNFERGGKHLMLMQPHGLSRDVTLRLHTGDHLLLSIDTRMGDG